MPEPDIGHKKYFINYYILNIKNNFFIKILFFYQVKNSPKTNALTIFLLEDKLIYVFKIG